mgnify:CR=1 FL=1
MSQATDSYSFDSIRKAGELLFVVSGPPPPLLFGLQVRGYGGVLLSRYGGKFPG